MSKSYQSFVVVSFVLFGLVFVLGQGCSTPATPAVDQTEMKQASEESKESTEGTEGCTDCSKDCAKDCTKDGMTGIEKSVENIENGIVVTITASCPKIVAKLQSHGQDQAEGKSCGHHQHGQAKMEGVEKSYEKLENGIKITLTAKDPEGVKKLQGHGKMGKAGHGPHHAKDQHGSFMMKGVEKSVELIENGVKITMTTKCPHTLKKLQEHTQAMVDQKPCSGSKDMKDLEKSVEKIENGVCLTLTSKNPESVKMIQAHAQKEGPKPAGDCPCTK